MTNDTDQATLLDGSDAVDIDVASDPAEARTIVTGLTVSASEKVSTGDYENYEPFQSVRMAFDPAIDASDPAGRVEVRKRAMRAHRDLLADLNEAVDARLSDPDFEDWPQGVDAAQMGDQDD